MTETSKIRTGRISLGSGSIVASERRPAVPEDSPCVSSEGDPRSGMGSGSGLRFILRFFRGLPSRSRIAVCSIHRPTSPAHLRLGLGWTLNAAGSSRSAILAEI